MIFYGQPVNWPGSLSIRREREREKVQLNASDVIAKLSSRSQLGVQRALNAAWLGPPPENIRYGRTCPQSFKSALKETQHRKNYRDYGVESLPSRQCGITDKWQITRICAAQLPALSDSRFLLHWGLQDRYTSIEKALRIPKSFKNSTKFSTPATFFKRNYVNVSIPKDKLNNISFIFVYNVHFR